MLYAQPRYCRLEYFFESHAWKFLEGAGKGMSGNSLPEP